MDVPGPKYGISIERGWVGGHFVRASFSHFHTKIWSKSSSKWKKWKKKWTLPHWTAILGKKGKGKGNFFGAKSCPIKLPFQPYPFFFYTQSPRLRRSSCSFSLRNLRVTQNTQILLYLLVSFMSYCQPTQAVLQSLHSCFLFNLSFFLCWGPFGMV